MIIVINKCAKTATVYSDVTAVAELFNVHRDTITARLPYWEDADHIICETYDFIKTKRGRKKKG